MIKFDHGQDVAMIASSDFKLQSITSKLGRVGYS